jgi:hypothetical protein
MSLTLISSPANIDNSASYEIDTDLVEDSSHVNLRIRAEIYNEGIIQAVIEKPKGLTVFDFGDILKSLTPGLKFARNPTGIYSNIFTNMGSVGANLITSMAGTYSTFTSTGSEVTHAIGTSPAFCNTNNTINLILGHIYEFHLANFVDNLGGHSPQIQFGDSVLAPLCPELIQAPIATIESNKTILLMCIRSGSFTIKISNSSSSDWSGALYLHEIKTDKNEVGSPLCPYYPMFTEIWETALGVTTLGYTSVNSGIIGLKRFVPAKIDALFSNYVLSIGTSQFANQTIRNTITKYFTYYPSEFWIVFFTESLAIDIYYSVDGAGYANILMHCYEGWGVILLNTNGFMSGVTTSLRFYIKDHVTGVTISEVFTVYVDSSQIDSRVVLEYDGLLGGKEYLAFAGKKQIKRHSIRTYRTGSKKGRKPLAYFGVYNQSLETRFGPGVNDMANASYLVPLLDSEVVKKMNPGYAEPTDVTIVTDDVITESSDMFTNPIDIEYED